MKMINLLGLLLISCTSQPQSLSTLLNKNCGNNGNIYTTSGVLSVNEGELFSELYLDYESFQNTIKTNSILIPYILHERTLDRLELSKKEAIKLNGEYINISGEYSCEVIRPYINSGKFNAIKKISVMK